MSESVPKHAAYCGINCNKCPVYRAEKEEDEVLRGKCAESWSQVYEVELTEGDISCEGCKAGNLFFKCRECAIRDCAVSRGIELCRNCTEYKCERIEEFLAWVGEKREHILVDLAELLEFGG